MLQPVLKQNDRLAYILITAFSLVVFAVVTVLSQFHFMPAMPFNVHVFATLNAIINGTVSMLLVYGFYLVKSKNFVAHKRVMMAAMVLSVLFLLSYIAHHLLAPETRYGGQGAVKIVYLIILATHIFLAGVIMPVVLFAAYRALTGQYDKHKKITRYAWPVWLYVSVTGVVVYCMISPYYV
jgi:putative membrane protein